MGNSCCKKDSSPKDPSVAYSKTDDKANAAVTNGEGGLVNNNYGTLPPLEEKVEPQDTLVIDKVDFNFTENGQLHNTSKYELMRRQPPAGKPSLVVRRGQDFFLNIYFKNRPFDKNVDSISFVFTFTDGKTSPSLSHGTLIVVPLLTKDSSLRSSMNWLEWTAYAMYSDSEDNCLRVQIKPSAVRCPVGIWSIGIDTRLKGVSIGDEKIPSTVSYKANEVIYILFNPWCEDDQVYLEDEAARQEYILEDTGLIWRGNANRLRPTPWAYSQFDKNVLDCALYLLKGPGKVSPAFRGDPVKVSRALSAAVNSPDDNGLIQGNWSENFDGGTPPTSWTGSSKIIQKYFESKKPVKFGQCWVFSGALCSIARTLGIPCRPVTNFSSAHDTQSSLTIDYFFDETGKKVEELNTDSIWNFHVWNEVWMTRSDLDNNLMTNAGWQVIDATPQEQSDEMYRCGPASIKAVKRGDILKPFDANFVFSEVNADKVYWLKRRAGAPLKLLGKKAEGIGMYMSTKAIGKFEREDITDQYKHPENSAEERETMRNALRMSENQYSKYYLNEDFNDLRFDFDLIDDIVIGSPFRVILKIQNFNKDKDYNVHIILRVDAMHYTGKVKKEVRKETYDKFIPAGSDEDVVLDVTYNNYFSKLCDQCDFNVACLVTVKETDFEYFAQDDFRVRKPDIKFEIPSNDSITIGKTFNGKLLLKNPLPVPLTKCRFLLETPGLGEPMKFKVKGSIKPGEIANSDFELLPHLDGDKTLSAKFYSSELNDVDGFVTVTVNPSNEIPLN